MALISPLKKLKPENTKELKDSEKLEAQLLEENLRNHKMSMPELGFLSGLASYRAFR